MYRPIWCKIFFLEKSICKIFVFASFGILVQNDDVSFGIKTARLLLITQQNMLVFNCVPLVFQPSGIVTKEKKLLKC